MQGLIALDIDGTITHQLHSISEEIVHYLHHLYQKGWVIFFVTGRPYQFSEKIILNFPFPFYLAVQNGAIVLEMPSKKIIGKKYISNKIFPKMEKICFERRTDFVIYGGVELEDHCLYRPQNFQTPLLDYLRRRCEALGEVWEAVAAFDHLPMDSFPSLKCFGNHQEMINLSSIVEEKLHLHVPVIKDPFGKGHVYVAQATHAEVDKGKALKELKRLLAWDGIVIAAGDDANDLPMLKEADYKIVIDTASHELQKHADEVAPSCPRGEGLISALNKLIAKE